MGHLHQKLIILALAVLACAFSAHAQTFPTAPINGPGPPVNPCSNGVLYTENDNGNLWSCKAGAWILPTSGSFPNPTPDANFGGQNPYIDIRSQGARAVSPSAVPAIPGITANCTNGSTSVTISGASTFQNGDGVAVYGCGPTNAVIPAAPTVASVVMSSQTGTFKAVAATPGSTTYCYQLMSRTFMGGTAIGPEACTTTGPATIGSQTASISSVSLSNNVATFTTSAPHGLPVGNYLTQGTGPLVVITGVTTAQIGAGSFFNGWFEANTVPDTTHFTVPVLIDSRSGATTTGTGGTVNYWNAIQITAPETTNNFQYYIYGRVSGGTKVLIGTMTPQNHALSGEFAYLTWDDYGSPVSALPLPPYYVPTTVPAPSTVTNDMLSTTIVFGAGTTSLVLADSASATISGQTILHDSAIGFAKAVSSSTTQGSNAYVGIPSTANAATSFVFNAPIVMNRHNVRAVISQVGQILVNEPIQLADDTLWKGGIPATASLSGFSQLVTAVSTCGRASPCWYAKSPQFFENMNFTTLSANGTIQYIQDGGAIPDSTFKNIVWSVSAGGAVNYSLMHAYFRGPEGADFQFINNSMLGTQNGALVGLASSTPGMYFNDQANLKFDYLYLSGIGVAFGIPGPGAYLHVNDVYCQACYMPVFSVTGAGGSNGPLYAYINNFISDTTYNGPILANYAGNKTTYIGDWTNEAMTGSGNSPVNQQVSSSNLGIPSYGYPGGNGISFINSPIQVNDAQFGRGFLGLDIYSRSLELNPNFSFFTNGGIPAAPTCSTPASGTGFASGTYYVYYQPVFAGNGSTGQVSLGCVVTISASNIGIAASVPAAISGGTGNYDWFIGSTKTAANNCGVFGNTVGFDAMANCTGSGSGGGPLFASGGPAGLQNDRVWANNIFIVPVPLSALPSAAAGNAGQWRTISDSTAISAEGQTCASGGTTKAAAFSNGTVWKCF